MRERDQKKTVVAQAMENIRELITSGNYKTGDKIPTEQELGERFGIGRSSIREAITTFQYLGILEARVPKGTFLCERTQVSKEAVVWAIMLGNDDMWEILELRKVIEEAVFLSIIEKLKLNKNSMGTTLENLQKEVENMEAAVHEPCMVKFVEADYNFHNIIIEESGNKLFTEIFKILRAFLFEEIRKVTMAKNDLLYTIKKHQEIVDAMRAGEYEKAAAFHTSHLRAVKRLLESKTFSGN